MLVGTVIGVLIIPGLYYLFAQLDGGRNSSRTSRIGLLARGLNTDNITHTRTKTNKKHKKHLSRFGLVWPRARLKLPRSGSKLTGFNLLQRRRENGESAWQTTRRSRERNSRRFRANPAARWS